MENSLQRGNTTPQLINPLANEQVSTPNLVKRSQNVTHHCHEEHS